MSYIYRDISKNIIIDASNGLATGNIIYFKTKGITKLLIDDNNNIDISGTAMRFRGDFSNASAVNRCLIQSSVTNGNTAVGIVPNGTSTTSQLVLYNTKDTLTSGALVINQTASSANILTNNTSGGVPTSLNIGTGGLTAISIDTSQICSFSTLPTCTATPTSSTQLTTKTYVDTRSAWGYVGGVVDSSTTSVTITSASTTCLTATFTAVANRRYLITASWSMYGATPGGQVIDFDIKDGSTILNRSYWYLAVSGTQMSGFMQAYSTFTAGSKTITLAAFGEASTGGTFWNNGTTRNSLIIMDIGPT